ncbi:ywbO [Symbiodinium necroappetens]|uniref:YwbO protein n=1 Tax=Symbiodinium necroappetens TaxID=1628268 RepID=A0A812LTF0_9DINO|nr:ywbO [Symbiodinium necroappetens]
MELDIFSDVVCPWCFIGKRRLEAALAERPQPGLVTRWRAFQLNPGMPSEGMDRQAYLELKFGGADKAAQLYRQIAEVGEEVGIAFAFEKIRRTPNTVNAHRLIRMGAAVDREDAVVEALFGAYFLHGRDLSETGVLVEIADEAGLDRLEAAEFLTGDAEREAVESEDLNGRQAGITGVPTFIVNRRHAVPGAQPPEVLHKLFDLGREGAPAANQA